MKGEVCLWSAVGLIKLFFCWLIINKGLKQAEDADGKTIRLITEDKKRTRIRRITEDKKRTWITLITPDKKRTWNKADICAVPLSNETCAVFSAKINTLYSKKLKTNLQKYKDYGTFSLLLPMLAFPPSSSRRYKKKEQSLFSIFTDPLCQFYR